MRGHIKAIAQAIKQEFRAQAGDSEKIETGRERLPKCALYSLDTNRRFGKSGANLRQCGKVLEPRLSLYANCMRTQKNRKKLRYTGKQNTRSKG